VFSSVNAEENVLLLPDFQRSFGLFAIPFFNWECKVTSRMISTKIFFNYFGDFQFLLRELLKNFETDCKNSFCFFTSKFELCFLFTFASPSIHNFQDLIRFSKAGRKDMSRMIASKLFLKEKNACLLKHLSSKGFRA